METVRIVAIGDPHLRDDTLLASKKLVNSLLLKVSELRPDGIVVLGDTLHTHSTVKIAALSLAKRLFKGLKEIAPLIVLIGNHDITHNQVYLPSEETPDHSLVFLDGWDNVTVCDRAKTFTIGDHTFCGVPYVPPGRYDEAIEGIPIEKISSFFSHQQFEGVKAQLHREQLDGDKWPSNRPLNVCGHFHEAQTIGNNIEYIGTPQQQDAGESDNKAIALFTFSHTPLERGKKIGSVYVVYDRYPLEGTIKRKTFRIDGSDVKSLQSIATLAQTEENVVIKVEITGTTNELAALRKNVVYKNMEQKKNIVLAPVVHTPQSQQTVVQTTFLEQVHLKLQSDPEARKCFEMYFS